MSNSKFKKGLSDPRGAVFYFQDKLERSASKLFFKNTAGFTNNIKGFMDSYKVKKINFDYNKTEKNLISEEFMNKGYVKIGSPYDPELIKQISSKFENYILDKKFSYVRAKFQDDVYSRGLYRGHELIPESVQLLNDEIINIIEQYYKTHFQVSKFSFWRNYFVPPEVNKEKELISSNWHCDASNTSWVKLFVYLTDVTEDDGPFSYVEKSNRWIYDDLQNIFGRAISTGSYCHTPDSRAVVFQLPKQLRISHNFGRCLLDGSEQQEMILEKEKLFTSDKGNLCIFDPAGMHRGGICKSGTRIALQILMK